MIWEGQFFAHTGYAAAARHYALALDEIGVPITARPVDPFHAWRRSRPQDLARIRALAARPPGPRDLQVHHMMPPAFSEDPDACANVGYTVFETDRLPRRWVPACRRMDEIWVPSRFCADSFARAGVEPAHIHVIPHGVDTDRFHPQVPPLAIQGARGFIFLSLFYWSHRKGWDVLLRAYLSEFRPDEDVTLVIRAYALDYRELTDFLRSQFGRRPRPPILVLPFAIPDAEMPALYSAADAFVVPARGEGWGMPYAEAMATGLPTIATGWGGHLDFMDDTNAYLIDVARMAPIDEWMQRVTGAEPDHHWAEPSVDHLRQLMRRVFDHTDEARARGRAARESLLRDFTWRAAALKIRHRVEALGERLPAAEETPSQSEPIAPPRAEAKPAPPREPLRVLLDFAVTPETEDLQQFALDLAQRGYEVRCSLWPETEAHRVRPEIEALARPPEKGERIEDVGLRLSHADSFRALPTPLKVGLALWEETRPRGAPDQFNGMHGLLASSRAGAARLRSLGVTVPIEPLSVDGFERIISRTPQAGPLAQPQLLAPHLVRTIEGRCRDCLGLRLLVFADREEGSAARATALRVARDLRGRGLASVAVCLALQSGPPTIEDRVILLGRHHLLPPYRYLQPSPELVEQDLALGLQDLLAVLPPVEDRACEAFGLSRLPGRLADLLRQAGVEFRSRAYPSPVSHRLRRSVALVGPFNIACGLAEEARILCEASPRPITILSERVEPTDLVRNPDPPVRCYRRDGDSYGELLQEIVRRGSDVVHVEYNHGLHPPQPLAALAQHLRTIGVRTAVTIHAATPDTAPLADAFDDVIVNTSDAAERLAARGLPEDRIHTIPLPVRPLDPLTKEEARRKLGLGERPILATCGFALPHKGLLELIRALASLRPQFPDALLLICCPPHPHSTESQQCLDQCRRAVEEHQLQGSVRFFPEFMEMDSLAVLLQAADIIVFPYTRAADQDASGALRMALAARRPIIVSDLPIFADAGEAVLRVPPGHVPPLARTIESLLEDRAMQQRLASAAGKLAARWHPSHIARRHWCDVYRAFGDLQVHLEGLFHSSSSFAQVLTNLALALHAIGCDVSIDPWRRAADPSAALSSTLADLAGKPPGQGLTVRLTYPHQPEGIPGAERALILPWEVTHLPAGMAAALNANTDWVLTLSRFCQQILVESGVAPEKVGTVPCGVDTELFHPHTAPLDLRKIARAAFSTRPDLPLEPHSLFVFLHLGAAIKRKGTDLLIGAYCQEFTGRDPVLLLIKSSGGADARPWIEQAASASPDPPRLLYLQDETAPSLLPGYYTACDCLVHPCRGEGFGLPVLEAMACGRPAIVTNWSGPTDFCHDEIAYLLDYQLVPVSDFPLPVPPGALWAEPDRSQLRRLMRRAVENPADVKEKGRRAAREAAQWTWARSAYRLLEATGRLPRPPDQ
jgi:glycosyltransferase involved in cell wall biosynthesis